ncbi:MAG: pre-peptidase C-terminal domain-containing protein, partial [Bacteroidota bacterium]
MNCTSVNILLSTDGGQSFTTLLANTPNDGSQAVAISTSGGVPNTACRIKVEAADNIFFDISNTNFTISAPAACGLPASLQSSGIGLTSATVSWAAVTGATSYNVGYKAASATTWTNLPAQTGTSATITGLTAATLYDWRVQATCSAGTGNFAASQFTTATDPNACPGPLDISTNGTTSGAAVIPFNTDVKGRLTPKGDIDYYKFTITTGGTISLSLSTLPADYDLRLYNSTGTVVASALKIGTTSETFSYAANPGTYFAHVSGQKNANNATACYTLRVNNGTASRDSNDLITSRTFTGEPVTIYPNPASSVLTIEAPWGEGSAEVQL